MRDRLLIFPALLRCFACSVVAIVETTRPGQGGGRSSLESNFFGKCGSMIPMGDNGALMVPRPSSMTNRTGTAVPVEGDSDGVARGRRVNCTRSGGVARGTAAGGSCALLGLSLCCIKVSESVVGACNSGSCNR